MAEKIELDGGKYTVIQHDNHTMEALRHGEPWRDLTGDNLVYYMLQQILDLEEKVQYQKDRADANWKALCECRNEETE